MDLQYFIVRIYIYVLKRIPTTWPTLNNLDNCFVFVFFFAFFDLGFI